MRLPLREKIQNAINRVLNDDGHVYNDCNNNDGQDGAFKVGGRRRNRKKKKNNKKNGQKKKKSPRLESIKAKLSPPRCRKGSSSSRKQEDDVTPLISDEEDTKDEMPLFGKKKKEEAPPPKEEPPQPAVEDGPAGDAAAEKTEDSVTEAKDDVKEQTPKDEPVLTKETPEDAAKEENTATEEKDDKLCEVTEEPALAPDENAAEPAPDGKATEKPEEDPDSSTQTQPVTVTYAKDSDGVTSDEGKVALPGTTAVKSEKSPLITKNGSDGGPEVNGSGLKENSPLKDMQPGIVCPCTIL